MILKNPIMMIIKTILLQPKVNTRREPDGIHRLIATKKRKAESSTLKGECESLISVIKLWIINYHLHHLLALLILLQAEMERSKCILVKKAKKKMGTRKMRVKSNLKYYKWHVTSSRRLPPVRYVSSLRDKSWCFINLILHLFLVNAIEPLLVEEGISRETPQDILILEGISEDLMEAGILYEAMNEAGIT